MPADPRGDFEALNMLLEDTEAQNIFGLLSHNDDWVAEFWETGSVTIEVNGVPYVLTLNVQQVSSEAKNANRT